MFLWSKAILMLGTTENPVMDIIFYSFFIIVFWLLLFVLLLIIAIYLLIINFKLFRKQIFRDNTRISFMHQSNLYIWHDKYQLIKQFLSYS